MTEHELKYPIETKDGRTLNKLQLKRLTIGELESVSEETQRTTKSIKMLAMSAQLSADDVRLMDAADFEEASDVVAGFLGA